MYSLHYNSPKSITSLNLSQKTPIQKAGIPYAKLTSVGNSWDMSFKSRTKVPPEREREREQYRFREVVDIHIGKAEQIVAAESSHSRHHFHFALNVTRSKLLPPQHRSVPVPRLSHIRVCDNLRVSEYRALLNSKRAI
jgi:hypothetical protein